MSIEFKKETVEEVAIALVQYVLIVLFLVVLTVLPELLQYFHLKG